MLFLCKAGGFLSLRDMGFPILRSLLTSYTSSEMYGEYYGESMTAIIFSFFVGSVLTISSAIEAFSSSGSSILFNEVYHPEAVVNGHNINAGVIFWISAGIWALNIPLVL